MKVRVVPVSKELYDLVTTLASKFRVGRDEVVEMVLKGNLAKFFTRKFIPPHKVDTVIKAIVNVQLYLSLLYTTYYIQYNVFDNASDALNDFLFPYRERIVERLTELCNTLDKQGKLNTLSILNLIDELEDINSPEKVEDLKLKIKKLMENLLYQFMVRVVGVEEKEG